MIDMVNLFPACVLSDESLFSTQHVIHTIIPGIVEAGLSGRDPCSRQLIRLYAKVEIVLCVGEEYK